MDETESKLGKTNDVTSFLDRKSMIETTPESDAAAIICETFGLQAKSVTAENFSDFLNSIKDAF